MVETGLLAEIILHPQLVSTTTLGNVFQDILQAMRDSGGRSFKVTCHNALLALLKQQCAAVGVDCIGRKVPLKLAGKFTCLRLMPPASLFDGT